MPFEFQKTELPEVWYVELRVFADQRGSFAEMYKQTDFAAAGVAWPLLQINHAHSVRYVVRALHYQNEPHAQGKLVFCPAGKIFDVAVDIRQGSPTYGKWVGKTLTGEQHNALYIPPGFAHGFGVLSESAEVIYGVFGALYAPESEAGIIWNDPAIGIAWPIPQPILTERDAKYPSLSQANNSFHYHG